MTALPFLPGLDQDSLGSKGRMRFLGAVAPLGPGPLATPIYDPWEGQWRGFGHSVRELPWILLTTLASSRVTPHGA